MDFLGGVTKSVPANLSIGGDEGGDSGIATPVVDQANECDASVALGDDVAKPASVREFAGPSKRTRWQHHKLCFRMRKTRDKQKGVRGRDTMLGVVRKIVKTKRLPVRVGRTLEKLATKKEIPITDIGKAFVMTCSASGRSGFSGLTDLKISYHPSLRLSDVARAMSVSNIKYIRDVAGTVSASTFECQIELLDAIYE